MAEAREAAREATLLLQGHHEEDILKVLNHLNILNLPIVMPIVPLLLNNNLVHIKKGEEVEEEEEEEEPALL